MSRSTSGRRTQDRLVRLGLRALDRLRRLSRSARNSPSRLSSFRRLANRRLNPLGRLSQAQRRLTAVIVMAPLLAWSCALPTGAGISLWMLTAVVVLALITAIRPDSQAGLTTVVLVGWYWLTQVSAHDGDPASPWALGAALSLLAFHAATAARATAPGRADLDAAFWRRWLSRTAIIAAGTCGVWGLTVAMASPHPGRAGLTVAAFAFLAGGLAYARWVLARGPAKTPNEHRGRPV